MSFTDSGYSYFIITDTAQLKTCTLAGFSGAVIPAVVIPLTATNAGTTYNVTAISTDAFLDTTGIESITITEITDEFVLGTNSLLIGIGAFSGITALTGAGTTITIPKQVTSIGNSAFYDTNLTSLVFAPNSKCATIGPQAFSKPSLPTTLVGTLEVPESLTSIGQQAFVGTGLVRLDLVAPATTLDIGAEAFASVSTLFQPDPFFLPPGVTAAADAFTGTALVFGGTFSTGDYNYVITSEAPQTCMLTGFSGGGVADVVIPLTATNSGTGTAYNVTAIGNSAFKNNTTINSITITEITDEFVLGTNSLLIGIGAFSGITALTGAGTAITIPKQVVKIYDSAFENTPLTSLSFNAGSKCTTIGARAFTINIEGTAPTIIGTLIIPNTVTSIGVEAFLNTQITTLTITDINTTPALAANRLTIGSTAFGGIISLNSQVTIPTQVTSIGNSAFTETTLTSLAFTLPSNCATIGNFAFTRTGLATLAGPLTIPNTVTSIGDSAFLNIIITALTITDIGTTPELTANTLTIGNNAFKGITTLIAGGRAITIPKQVVSIGDGAFQNTNLTSLVFTNGSKCTTIGASAFASDIVGIAPTLAGTLTIPNTVTSIGNIAFFATKITALTITDIGTTAGLQANELTIGQSAFQGIKSLTAGGRAITIPKQVTSIGNFAFADTNLLSLVFTNESKCTTIGNNAFSESNGQSSTLAGALTIPNTVTSIGESAFFATNITALTITDIGDTPGLQENELTIDAGAFAGIKSLTTGLITIPTQVVSINNFAFTDTNLTSLVFTNGSKCTTIGEQAFRSANPPATLVGELAIPASLTSIGQQAFVGTGLVTLTLPTLTQALLIGQEAFLDVATLRLPNPFILPALLTVGTDAFKGTKLVFGPPTPPTPGQTFTSDNNLYLVTSTAPPTCTLQGFSGAPTATLTVPATVTSGGQAYTVTAIAANAYKDNAVITTLLISAQSKLVKIGPNTFEGALNLTLPNPLTFPATIQVIGQNAFAGTGLTIIYPADMQQLANGARSRASVAGRLGST